MSPLPVWRCKRSAAAGWDSDLCCRVGLEYTIEQRESYAVVRVDGEPTLDEVLGFVQAIGSQSRDWPVPCALVDLRAVRSLKTFTEHYAIGEAVGRELLHLRKVASVVPADRITRASEKRAQHAGVNLTVFTSEGDAMAWLRT